MVDEACLQESRRIRFDGEHSVNAVEVRLPISNGRPRSQKAPPSAVVDVPLQSSSMHLLPGFQIVQLSLQMPDSCQHRRTTEALKRVRCRICGLQMLRVDAILDGANVMNGNTLWQVVHEHAKRQSVREGELLPFKHDVAGRVAVAVHGWPEPASRIVRGSSGLGEAILDPLLGSAQRSKGHTLGPLR